MAGPFLSVLLIALAATTAGGAPPAAPYPPGAPGGHLIPWAVDPEDPGEDLPPVGRSIFDFLVTERTGDERFYAVPFPFSALVSRVEERLGSSSAFERVLLPLGRS